MSHNQSLKEYTTLAVDAACRELVPLYSELDVYKALVYHEGPYRILGGGSNVLLSGDVEDIVLLNCIKGISIIDEDEDSALVSVGSGEYWHQFVLWCLSHDLGGLENLSLIPGKVGAAPMQNIGAYGVEQEAVFHSLKAIHLEEGTSKVFFKEDCDFGYRDSIFKQAAKGQYIITSVNYLLTKKHNLVLSYGAIQDRLAEQGVQNPTIHDVSQVIIDIRKSKLPDPKVIPNAGSFFKNPVITHDQLGKLKNEFPDIKYYTVDHQYAKIPAAYLIEQAGCKGIERSGAGTHKGHALVLVNYDNASGAQLLSVASEIEQAVVAKYGIQLEKEVNVW